MLTLTIKNRIKVPYINKALDTFIYDSLIMTSPKWLENERMGYSNWKVPRKLYFLDDEVKDDLFVPRGFLDSLIEYCNDNQIEFEIDNQTHIFEPIDFKFNGDLRPFQEVATKIMLSENEGTAWAPTGSGKTIMALYMIAERQQPTIIIVHTKELLDQWTERIKTFLNIDEQRIGRIGDGHFDKNQAITIALIQTLSKYPETVNDYGFLIIDECHKIPAKTFTTAVKTFEGRYLLGLSATPYRRDGLSKVIEWYAGPIRHEIKPQELIKSGHITSIETVIRKTNFIASMPDPAAEYSKLLQEISMNVERNQMIIDDILTAAAMGETCLVLTDRKAHCQELKNMILAKSKIKTEVLTGDVLSEPRRRIVEDVNAGKIKILISTSQLIGEGFDCKELTAIFLTLPIRFPGRVIQYLGRVLRPAENKDFAFVYDYFDQNVRCLYGGFKERKKIYEKLKLEE